MTSVSAPAQTPSTPDDVGRHASVSGTPIWFGGSRPLAGWFHPANGPTRLDSAVVLCSPLGYEELCVHRAMRHWARALACAGVATLRFDYDGTGNSTGLDTDDGRVEAWISNIGEAVRALRSRAETSSIVLAGVRLGGTLAMAAAARVGVDGLILFGVQASGRPYARELRAFGQLMGAAGEAGSPTSNGAGVGVEQVAGFVLTRPTLDDLTKLDPLACPVGVRRALVIPRDDVAGDGTLGDRLAAHGVEVERATVPGYAAMMVDAHESVAPSQVIDASIRWLTAHYSSRGGIVSPVKSPAHQGSPAASLVDGPVSERAVVFGEERGLFGVLSEHVVRDERVGTGIILANAGSVHHVGPGRMYVTLAREWATLGFSVLRFDVGGVGDSETRAGSADNHPYPNHAVDDVECAARWLVEHAGLERVVVTGLCSGAHASFHAGLELDCLAGIVVINPIVFYWNPSCALDVSAWMNYSESRRYRQSARNVGSWMRLARGQVNVRHAAAVAYRRAREVLGGSASAVARRLGIMKPARDDVARDLARVSAKGVTTLLVFSEGDPGLDFVRRRHAREIRLLERDRRNFAMRVVQNADHTFTRLEARDRLRQLLTTHLMERHRGLGHR